ncbi:MAG: non-canonical purine NTP pyrophosphatase, partial [Candidatus Levybacteria bacterium CG10_big_fil_rev_8_21_14_0_10_36_7]
DCLNGLPGPLIKWFIKTVKNEGIAKLAEKFGDNKAVAKTFIGYAKSRRDIHFFEGEVVGEIVYPRGNNGFGWNPIFQPNGETRTFGEMSLEEKQKFSMRKIAADKLKAFLNKNI